MFKHRSRTVVAKDLGIVLNASPHGRRVLGALERLARDLYRAFTDLDDVNQVVRDLQKKVKRKPSQQKQP